MERDETHSVAPNARSSREERFRFLRVTTIRGRLLVIFLLMGVVPVLVIALTGVIFAWRSGQTRVLEQVDLIARTQQGEIEIWLTAVRTALERALAEQEAISYARLVLQPRVRESGATDTYANLTLTLLQVWSGYVDDVDLFDAVFLVTSEGRVLLSTDQEQTGKTFWGQSVLEKGLAGFSVLTAFPGLRVDPSEVLAVLPVLDQEDQVIGVLVGRSRLPAFGTLAEDQLGESGEIYLVSDRSALTLTPVRIGGLNVQVPLVAEQMADGHQDGMGSYTNYGNVPVVGAYRWLPELGAVLVVEQARNEALRAISTMLIANSSIALIVAVVSVVVALTLSRTIAGPLTELAGTAEQIAAGDLASKAVEKGADEVCTLARSFNSMTVRLSEVIDGLETSVAERTSDLERRSRYAEAAAEVGRAASAILDAVRLQRFTVDLIRDRMAMYYVGLFLVDESGEWAVLRAGTGEAGQRMIARGHQIRVGEGMIGWAIQRAQAQIVADVREDSTRVAQEELPETRSEVALPLRSRGRVLGALTVQGTRERMFDQELLVVLQTMADQVAVALDNARLFEESRAALAAARRASGDLSIEAWTEVLRARTDLGFRSDERGVERDHRVWRPEMERAALEGTSILGVRADNGGQSLAVPIRMHGEVIGVLDTYKSGEDGAWTSEQIALVEQIVEQLSLSLENARLYQETQRRGIREQQLREIGTRMQSTVDLDAILRMAVEDLARALDVPSAFVQLYEGRARPEE